MIFSHKMLTKHVYCYNLVMFQDQNSNWSPRKYVIYNLWGGIYFYACLNKSMTLDYFLKLIQKSIQAGNLASHLKYTQHIIQKKIHFLLQVNIILCWIMLSWRGVCYHMNKIDVTL